MSLNSPSNPCPTCNAHGPCRCFEYVSPHVAAPEPVDDGGPAFPLPGMRHPNGEYEWPNPGMSLRAWLAAKEDLRDFDDSEVTISALLAETLAGEPMPEGGWKDAPVAIVLWEAKWRAALKLIRADALIAALKRPASAMTGGVTMEGISSPQTLDTPAKPSDG